jgi:hypothetical protein
MSSPRTEPETRKGRGCVRITVLMTVRAPDLAQAGPGPGAHGRLGRLPVGRWWHETEEPLTDPPFRASRPI